MFIRSFFLSLGFVLFFGILSPHHSEATQQVIKVLLVEDSMMSGKFWEAYLKKSGFHVDWAKNLEEANSAIQRQQYAGVFLDHQFPRTQGTPATGLSQEIISSKPILI